MRTSTLRPPARGDKSSSISAMVSRLGLASDSNSTKRTIAVRPIGALEHRSKQRQTADVTPPRQRAAPTAGWPTASARAWPRRAGMGRKRVAHGEEANTRAAGRYESGSALAHLASERHVGQIPRLHRRARRTSRDRGGGKGVQDRGGVARSARRPARPMTLALRRTVFLDGTPAGRLRSPLQRPDRWFFTYEAPAGSCGTGRRSAYARRATGRMVASRIPSRTPKPHSAVLGKPMAHLKRRVAALPVRMKSFTSGLNGGVADSRRRSRGGVPGGWNAADRRVVTTFWRMGARSTGARADRPQPRLR